MKTGFRVIEFSPKNFMGSNLLVNFYENKHVINTDAFSCVLIVGENGCGKTELVKRLLEAFSELEEFQSQKNVRLTNKRNRYLLRYSIDGILYEIESNEKYVFKKAGEEVDLLEIDLPQKFIAQSFSFADKFNYNSEGRYSYLGTRTASNASYISHIENSIVEIISTKMVEKEFIEFLKILLDFLKFDEKLEIVCEVSSMKRLSEILNSPDEFENKYTNMSKKRRINSQVERTLQEMKIGNVYEKVIDLVESYRVSDKTIKYKIDINDMQEYNDLSDFFIFMRVLSYMRVVSAPKINFYKHKKELAINSASSGEKQIIYSLLNVYSVIKPNSLVIIDEPEISLHPNWQMKYMKLLERVFSRYKNSHFIIATHSHFMVSDLKKENSSVIVMNRSSEGVSVATYNSDTYSWSAEDILYNVFKVPSSRNYYIASDVEEVIKAISTQNISEEIITKINNFKKILPNLKDIDPLKTIIEKILDKDLVKSNV